MGPGLRLTEAVAEPEVTRRDRKRNELLATLSRRDVADPTAYDLVVNAGRLGVAACAELIAQTVRAKQLPADGSASDEPS
jgi:cytidylate kinase